MSPVRKPARKPATYDDLVALPAHLVGEILDGELVVSPRPGIPHAAAATRLGGALDGAFGGPSNTSGGGGGPGGWWILDEPELRLDRDVVVPDLAGWRRERLPRLPNVASMTLAPDWVCEVLSPSTVRFDRVRKMRIYARVGVPWVWHVDPIAHTLEVFELVGKRYAIASEHDGEREPRVRAEPFAAVEIDMARWWADVETGPPPRREPTARPRKGKAKAKRPRR